MSGVPAVPGATVRPDGAAVPPRARGTTGKTVRGGAARPRARVGQMGRNSLAGAGADRIGLQHRVPHAEPPPPVSTAREAAVFGALPDRAVAPPMPEEEDIVATEAAEPAAPARPRKAVVRRPANVWTDPSLAQEITPWPARDKARVGAV